MSELERILLIRPSALGDVCRTVPVLASLRKAAPEARIDWVVNEGYLDAVAHHPALSGAIGFPRARFAAFWRSPALGAEIWRWAVALRRTRYDLVLDCQGLGRSGLIAWATGARLRVGYADAREAGWLGYNRRIEVPAGLHAVDRMLALAAAMKIQPVPDMRLTVPPAGVLWHRRYADRIGLGAAPYAVLAPTARWLGKRWPIERWAALVPALVERGFSRIFLIGSQGERDQVGGAIPTDASRAAVVNLVGRTNLAATFALLAHAGLVVANDSAPLHIAVGFDRPLVGLFGPTDPDRVGPYGHRDWVLRPRLTDAQRRISFKDDEAASIMAAISIEEVVSMIDRVLPTPRGSVVMASAAATTAASAERSGSEPSP